MNIEVFFGLLSTAMMLCSRSVYFVSIYKKETRPHLFSWVIWAVISCVGFTAQVVDGAGAGSWARGVSAATCFLLVIICIFRGEKNITRGDWVTLLVALTTIPLWILTKTPVWSVVLVCIIDTVGYLPTARKCWHKPHEETYVSYILSCLCALFALFAIENYTISTTLYSAVLTATNGIMAFFIFFRLGHLKKLAVAG